MVRMEKQVNIKEIHALIGLLDDPDEGVFEAVTQRLTELGTEIVPNLEKAWENTINSTLQTKIENLIHEIQFSSIVQEFYNWFYDGSKDLITGAYLVAKFQYPELKYEVVKSTLDLVKEDVLKELNQTLTPLEKIRVLNHVLFNNYKFSGNYSNYYSPGNFYINQVLDTRKGSPVTLAVIYISVAQMLDMPVFGVNLPKNFIVAFKDLYNSTSEQGVIFYANPYNKGAILGRREIEYFLKQQNIVANETYFNPCSNLQIIERMLRNLHSAYESLGITDKVERINKLLQIIE